MIASIKIGNTIEDFEFTHMMMKHVYLFMIGLKSAIAILEHRQASKPNDMSIGMELDELKGLFEKVDSQYPGWSGTAISLIEQNIHNTLAASNIKYQI